MEDVILVRCQYSPKQSIASVKSKYPVTFIYLFILVETEKQIHTEVQVVLNSHTILKRKTKQEDSDFFTSKFTTKRQLSGQCGTDIRTDILSKRINLRVQKSNRKYLQSTDSQQVCLDHAQGKTVFSTNGAEKLDFHK